MEVLLFLLSFFLFAIIFILSSLTNFQAHDYVNLEQK